MIKKWIIIPAILSIIAATLASCEQTTNVISRNLSRAADEFEIVRRVVFYNGITGAYILSVTGKCSLGNYDKSKELSVTCKTDDGKYVKHYLGLSDNVTFFAEQMAAKKVSEYHYRVIFKPQSIIPDFDFKGDIKALVVDPD